MTSFLTFIFALVTGSEQKKHLICSRHEKKERKNNFCKSHNRYIVKKIVSAAEFIYFNSCDNQRLIMDHIL